jgi:hypothetical protein
MILVGKRNQFRLSRLKNQKSEDAVVEEMDRPLRIGGVVGVMGDRENCPPLLLQLDEESQDLRGNDILGQL